VARRIGPSVRLVLLAAALLIATCAVALGLSARSDPVFQAGTGFAQRGPATTADVINVGIPPRRSNGDLPVRLLQVSLVTDSPHVHLLRVIAFRPDNIGYMPMSLGDLLQHCRAAYAPRPLTDVVVPPHEFPDWDVMVELTFDAPGRYVLGPVRIAYAEAGRLGWQDQNLNTTVVISAAPPGRKPSFYGC
jgi:hypothetical protein